MDSVDRALSSLEKIQSTRHQYSKAVAQVCLSMNFLEYTWYTGRVTIPAGDLKIYYRQVPTNGLEWKIVFVVFT